MCQGSSRIQGVNWISKMGKWALTICPSWAWQDLWFLPSGDLVAVIFRALVDIQLLRYATQVQHQPEEHVSTLSLGTSTYSLFSFSSWPFSLSSTPKWFPKVSPLLYPFPFSFLQDNYDSLLGGLWLLQNRHHLVAQKEGSIYLKGEKKKEKAIRSFNFLKSNLGAPG